MAKGALVFTWGNTVRGREMKALEVFGEILSYYDDLAKAGRVHGVRTYLSNTGDMSDLAGMLVVDGDLGELMALGQEPNYMTNTVKAENVVEHLRIQLMTGGSPDDIQETMGLFTETLGVLGLA